jgi:hypothetical protein
MVIKHTWLLFGVVLAVTACASSSNPPAPAPSATAPAAPPTAAAPAAVPAINVGCNDTVPYVVGWTDGGGAVSVSLAQQAKSQLANASPTISAAGDIKRIAAATFADGFDRGTNVLRVHIFMIADNISADPKYKWQTDSAIVSYTRQPTDPVLDTSILNQALPSPDFITVTTLTGNISAAVSSIGFGACGTVVREAVQDGGPKMAAALNSLRAAVISYFNNGSAAPSTAFISIAGNIGAVTPASSHPATASQGCTPSAAAAATT